MTLRPCHYVILLCGQVVHLWFFANCTLGITLRDLRYYLSVDPHLGPFWQLLILPRGRALLHHVSSLERLVRNQMLLLGCQWRFDRWHRILLEEGSVFSVRKEWPAA